MQVSWPWCRLALRTNTAGPATPVVVLALTLALALSVAPTWSQAQTLSAIHFFTGGLDGAYPGAGVVMDRFGNLYGTTIWGGINDSGSVFKLSYVRSGWILTPMYDFKGDTDGGGQWLPTIGSDGTVYGVADSVAYGEVYRLTPPPVVCHTAICSWNKNVVYQFTGNPPDGEWPSSNVIFDRAGNLYGTTGSGGAYGYGTVYELTPSNGSWTEKIIYSFTGVSDGSGPYALMIDAVGNLYGATYNGGAYNYGTVFEISPANGGWTENTLYSFNGVNDGGAPVGLVIDNAGNIYGISPPPGCVTGSRPDMSNDNFIFMLSPGKEGWSFQIIGNYYGCEDPTISMGADQNIYVIAPTPGILMRLTNISGTWTVTMVYHFGNTQNGYAPVGHVVVDAAGNIYGTMSEGGLYGEGSVWELTP